MKNKYSLKTLLVVFIAVLLNGLAVLAQKSNSSSLVYMYDRFTDYETWATPPMTMKNKGPNKADVFVTLETPRASEKENCDIEDIKQFRCSIWLGFRSTSGNFSRNKSIIALVDGERIIFASPIYTSEVRRVGKKLVVIEFLKTLITLEQLKNISHSETVEFKAGRIEATAPPLFKPLSNLIYMMIDPPTPKITGKY